MTNDTPVPAHPVVAIYIEDGLVMVDGSAVEHDGSGPHSRRRSTPLRVTWRNHSADRSGRSPRTHLVAPASWSIPMVRSPMSRLLPPS
jgi:hypothetical protein